MQLERRAKCERNEGKNSWCVGKWPGLNSRNGIGAVGASLNG